jgi:hypothetical protein
MLRPLENCDGSSLRNGEGNSGEEFYSCMTTSLSMLSVKRDPENSVTPLQSGPGLLRLLPVQTFEEGPAGKEICHQQQLEGSTHKVDPVKNFIFFEGYIGLTVQMGDVLNLVVTTFEINKVIFLILFLCSE